MNILVYPKDEFRIGDRTISFEAKFEEIIDNFKNNLIPKPRVKMNGGDYGVAIDYVLMKDGLYFEIELEDAKEFDLQGKFPTGKLIDFEDNKGNYYHNVLSEIVMNDTQQYFGNESKQLDAMSDCVREMIAHGKTQEQAVAICINKIGGTKLDYIQPKLQEGIDPQGEIKPKKSKLELLAEFKKQLEKNGFRLNDQMLEGLLQHIEITGELPQLRKLNQSIKLNIGIPTQVIKIFPRKKCYFERYEEEIDFNDSFFDDIIKNFSNPKLFKPYIDEDHNLEEKYADIIQLEKRDDGLYAHVELNSIGLDAIKNNKYSYISPEWGDRVDTDKKLHKNVLWAVTLTNIPAFEGELPRLQDQMKLKKEKSSKGEKQMDQKKLISLSKKLDQFKLEVDPNDLVPLVEEMAAMLQQMTAKIQEVMGEKEQVEEQLHQQEAQVQMMTKEKDKKEMNDFFEEAVKSGKIEAGEVETYQELYTLNKEKVRTLINGKKEIENNTLTSNSIKGNKLSKEDLNIMLDQGYNPDDPNDVSKYLKAIGGNA